MKWSDMIDGATDIEQLRGVARSLLDIACAQVHNTKLIVVRDFGSDYQWEVGECSPSAAKDVWDALDSTSSEMFCIVAFDKTHLWDHKQGIVVWPERMIGEVYEGRAR